VLASRIFYPATYVSPGLPSHGLPVRMLTWWRKVMDHESRNAGVSESA
jgi:hypothetical protein